MIPITELDPLLSYFNLYEVEITPPHNFRVVTFNAGEALRLANLVCPVKEFYFRPWCIIPNMGA